MTDGHALLAASRERPADDTPHLVYADWADDNGMPHAAAHIRETIHNTRQHPDTNKHLAGSFEMKKETDGGTGLGGTDRGVTLETHPDGTSTVQVLHGVPTDHPQWGLEHFWNTTIPHTEAVARVRRLAAEGHHPVGELARAVTEGRV